MRIRKRNIIFTSSEDSLNHIFIKYLLISNNQNIYLNWDEEKIPLNLSVSKRHKRSSNPSKTTPLFYGYIFPDGTFSAI